VLGDMLNGNLGWADVNIGSKIIDLDKVKLARMDGEITDMVGHRMTSWAGTWGTIGLVDYDWITGGFVNDPAFDGKADSYKIGWVQNMSLVCFSDSADNTEPDTYALTGARMVVEDTRAIGGDGYEDVDDASGSTKKFADAAFQFSVEWDLTAYDPENKAAGGATMALDYLDSADPGAGWYSDQVGDTFPAGGQPVGVNHGNWDPSQENYYDDFSNMVLAISLVEDEVGFSGSYTYNDITLDVVGRVAGDVNLDGYVTQADLDIANANLNSNDAHWGMGDVTGGGVNDWGGLDGIVDAHDIPLITAALGGGIEGDLNVDGSVNSGDLDLVRANWGRSDASSGLDGDANGDGYVNSSDLDIIRSNWGNSAPASAVPEPGLAMLVAAGLLALMIRRK